MVYTERGDKNKCLKKTRKLEHSILIALTLYKFIIKVAFYYGNQNELKLINLNSNSVHKYRSARHKSLMIILNIIYLLLLYFIN